MSITDAFYAKGVEWHYRSDAGTESLNAMQSKQVLKIDGVGAVTTGYVITTNIDAGVRIVTDSFIRESTMREAISVGWTRLDNWTSIQEADELRGVYSMLVSREVAFNQDMIFIVVNKSNVPASVGWVAHWAIAKEGV